MSKIQDDLDKKYGIIRLNKPAPCDKCKERAVVCEVDGMTLCGYHYLLHRRGQEYIDRRFGKE
jgi:hypothetical protein